MTEFIPAISDSSHVTRRAALHGGVLAGLGIAGLALFGCSEDESDAASTPGATSTASATGTTPSELVIANEAEPSDLFPWFGGFGQGLVTRQVYQTFVEPRLTLGAAGEVKWDVVGVLAESWDQVEPTRWRLKLRPGVTFHNGEPWDAAAAKASFDLLSNTAVTTELKKNNILAAVTSFSVVDPMTVEFTTAKPDPEVLTLNLRLGFVGLPPKLIAGEGWRSLREHPVGTGAYKFTSWSRGSDLRLERVANHWSPDAPKVQRLRFLPRPEASVRALAVQAGEAHLAYNIGPEQAAKLDHQIIGSGFQTTTLRLNNAIAPTNDIRVRQAINYAIDRAAIAKTIFRGAARPIAFFAFQPVKLDPFPYDLNKAKQLITQAGASGKEVELVYGENRIPEEPQLVELYKSTLDAIGLKVKLTRLEPVAYNDVGGRPFEQQPALFMETTSSGNYKDIASGLRDKCGCKGSGTFCDSGMDAEYDALAALSGAARDAKLQAVAERLHTQYVPRAWVLGVQQVHGAAPFIDGSRLPANAYLRFEDLRFA